MFSSRGEKSFGAIVRKPMHQVVSHFEFVSQRSEHALYAGDNLEHALTWESRFRQESKNMQCRCIANRETARETLQVIGRTPYILGCVDKIELFVDRLAETFAVPRIAMTYQNVQEQGYFERHCTSRTAQLIREITAEDGRLYSRVVDKGVISNID